MVKKMMITDCNYIKEDWDLFFAFFNGGSTDGPKRLKKAVS